MSFTPSNPHSTHSFRFDSVRGRLLCREILASRFPYEPHDYQLEGVTSILDGRDLLAITPTGSGKTGFLSMYIAIMLYFSENPSKHPLVPTASVVRNPCLLVVSPTKALEYDMETKFAALKIATVVINADTVDHARRRKADIWEAAACTASVVLLGPEQLKSPGFRSLLEKKDFAPRLVGLGVDEIHLLNSWGLEFRPVFRQIGDVRMRLTEGVVVIGTTATLRPGSPTDNVTDFLRFRTSGTHTIRLSNARYDIQHCWRQMQSGARAKVFRELDWLLDEGRNIILFCPTISLGTRILIYLWSQAASLVDRPSRLRMYNSLNSESYNTTTLSLMREGVQSRITVATDTLAQGIDVAQVDDVVLYGDIPKDPDSVLQKIGRIRDGRGKGSRAVIYLPKNAADIAHQVLKSTSKTHSGVLRLKSDRDTLPPIDLAMARLILAPCKVDIIDTLYGNTETSVQSICQCRTCAAQPPAVKKVPCNCSGCSPASSASNTFIVADNADTVTPTAMGTAVQLDSPPSDSTTSDNDAATPLDAQTSASALPSGPKRDPNRLTKEMRQIATARFVQFRWALLDSADECEWGMTLSDGFLPDELIKNILDDFPKLTGALTLPVSIRNFVPLADHLQALADVVRELQDTMEELRAAKKVAAAEQRAERARKKREAAFEAALLAVSDVVMSGSEGEGEILALPDIARSAGTIRIPGGRFTS